MIHIRQLWMTGNVDSLLERAILSAAQEAEVCGLLGGFFGKPGVAVARAVHPLSNLSLRKDSFAVDVEEFCRERDAAEEKGLLAVALYHSHPDGSTRPSFRDRKLPCITDLPSLIVAWDGEKLLYECYGEEDGNLVPIQVVVEDPCLAGDSLRSRPGTPGTGARCSGRAAPAPPTRRTRRA